jgi:integrase
MPRPATGQVIEREGRYGKTYALRFRAYGRRRYLTLGTVEEGWSSERAETELQNLLADVRRGIWREPDRAPMVEKRQPARSFHAFASEWLAALRHELRPRSIEALEWALSGHLLAHFADFELADITPEEVDRYKLAKAAEGTLSARSTNKTIAVLAQVLDTAVEYGHLPSNAARGKRRRLKAGKPRRIWLELDEVRDLLDAAKGPQRAMLATMILAGLRVGELVALRWRDVDLANGKLRVEAAKTDAGERVVDLSPALIDELGTHKAAARYAAPDALVFSTRTGRPHNRSNVRSRTLGKAIEQANEARGKEEKSPIAGVTNHSLRRTFASLLYEAGASPAYVMAQLGHTSSALALEVYARMMERERDTGARMDALVRGTDWARTGTNGAAEAELLSGAASRAAG